jgi:6-pyruvoyltetrahydropterin/6-carboxytetrahydropterin synthase
MPYRICKTFEIENGHMLSKHPDKCRFPHGHSRRVECVLESPDLDANDMVCDFKVFREILAEFLEQYDHAMCINTADPMFNQLRSAYGTRIIPFEQTDPTTEVMAKVLHDHFKAQLLKFAAQSATPYPVRQGLRVVSVRLWETSTSWAEYSESR